MTRTVVPSRSLPAAGRASTRSGFALLMALVLVMLAGVALAGIARRSATEALHARTDVEDLRHRWAVTSLRALLGPRIAPTLAEAGRAVAEDRNRREQNRGSTGQRDDVDAPPMRSMWLSLELAGQRYDLRFTDEQAKVDVNRLLEATDTGTVRSVVEQLVSGHGGRQGASVETDLHPIVRGDFAADAIERLDAIAGWGQLFNPPEPGGLPAALAGSPDRPGLTQHLTLFGGPINIHTAPEAVIRAAGGAVLGVYRTEQLMQARAEQRNFALRDWLDGQSDWEDRQRSTAGQWFTGTSNTHGLWLIARTRQRDHYHLTLARTAPGPAPAPERPDSPDGSSNDEAATDNANAAPNRQSNARAQSTAAEVVADTREAAARPRVMIERIDFDW